MISHYWEKYKFEVYANDAVQSDYEWRYERLLRLAEGTTSPVNTVFDVGCGIGNFLAFAEARGLQPSGVDIEAAAVEVARSRGLRAEVSGRADSLLNDRAADVVTMWDVIEHLYDPEPAVREALKKLRPGGVFLLETPDGGFWVRKLILRLQALSRGRVDITPYMYYWEHKIYFTERGLTQFLQRLGCVVVHVHREPSPRAKMRQLFGRDSSESLTGRLLASTWPMIEATTRRAGGGNKLMVAAIRTDATD